MSSKNIFIHIPKTGGTTINCVINKSEWQTTPDFNYRHIIYETKRSNTKDIFNPRNYGKYEEHNLFMLLRHPVDRIISEYYFMKDRPEFMNLIKPVPRNLKEYVKNKQTHNYMVGFLVGKRMYDEDIVREDDLKLVVNTINSLQIKVGIFEKYKESLAYFSSVTGIKIPKKIEVKRITLNRPRVEEVSSEIKELIIQNNQLDYELYTTFLLEFNKLDVADRAIVFNSNKYNYILKYTERFNLLETGGGNKRFIHQQKEFFNNLNNYLHNTLKVNNGKRYVEIWNSTFIATIETHYPNTILSKALREIDIDDPLSKTKKMCNILDRIFNGKQGSQFKKQLIFKEELVVVKSRNNIFSKITSRLFS